MKVLQYFYLIETNSFGCETINSLSIEINDYSSVTENSMLDYLIYPNPVEQNTNINILNEKEEVYNLSFD